jgi:hypothetical protein
MLYVYRFGGALDEYGARILCREEKMVFNGCMKFTLSFSLISRVSVTSDQDRILENITSTLRAHDFVDSAEANVGRT